LFIGPRVCSTLPSDPASRRQPLRFAITSPPSGCEEDFHLQAVEHARRTKEELLIPKEDLSRIWVLRKVLNPLSPVEAMELLIDKLSKTRGNSEFLANMSAL